MKISGVLLASLMLFLKWKKRFKEAGKSAHPTSEHGRYYNRGATASKNMQRGSACNNMTVEWSDDIDIDIDQSTKGRLGGGEREGGVGQFQFPLSAESGLEISYLGSQIYTHFCPAQRNNTQHWGKYNLVKKEIQHLINLTNPVKLSGENGLLQSECEVQGQRGAWCGAEE